MKILQLTKKVPFPLKDGESIAVTQLATGLVPLGCEIDLLSFNSIKHSVNSSEARKGMPHYNRFETVFLDNRVKVIPAFLNLFSKHSYNISRFKSKEYKKKLIEILEANKYDIVLIESLFMVPYLNTIKNYSSAKIVMRSHNIEHKIWKRLASNEKSFIKKAYLDVLWKRIKSYEYSMATEYDLLLPISYIDATYYKKNIPSVNVCAIPTGFDEESFPILELKPNHPIKFFFIGSLDWKPNIDGLNWFIENVWKDKDFEGEFYIAGRNCPQSILDIEMKDLYVLGEIENAHTFMHENDVMVAPLFSGSGIRIKILESMMLGRPVISTDVGCEGIKSEHNKDIFIANDSKEFIEIMTSITRDSSILAAIANEAKKNVTSNFGQIELSKKTYQLLKNISV